MQETDFLYPNDMIAQSEVAVKLLQKENQDIKDLDSSILAFVEDETLVSQQIDKAKNHFNSYHILFNEIMEANEQDIASFEQIKEIISENVHEDLCGNIIFTTKRTADANYESEMQKAEWYSSCSGNAFVQATNPAIEILFRNIAVHHRQQALHWSQISMECQRKMDLFDEIEYKTSLLFVKENSITKAHINTMLEKTPREVRCGQVIPNRTITEMRECPELLYSYLKAEDIVDEEQIQNIYRMVALFYPHLLSSFEGASRYSTLDCKKIAQEMIKLCDKYGYETELVNACVIIDEYLKEKYMANTGECKFIMEYLIENYSEELKGLNVELTVIEELEQVVQYYVEINPCIGDYYIGKYLYPVEYIDGIVKTYEEHIRDGNGRFIIDNGGKTIGYGHDILEGEDFSAGLSEEEALRLAISDLDSKYDDIIQCISEINEMENMNICIEDFSENERMCLVDFAFNRGRGLYVREELKLLGKPNSSLALLTIAIYEEDNEMIKEILLSETCPLEEEKKDIPDEEKEPYNGLILRRMDEYEILKYAEYGRDYELNREVWQYEF